MNSGTIGKEDDLDQFCSLGILGFPFDHMYACNSESNDQSSALPLPMDSIDELLANNSECLIIGDEEIVIEPCAFNEEVANVQPDLIPDELPDAFPGELEAVDNFLNNQGGEDLELLAVANEDLVVLQEGPGLDSQLSQMTETLSNCQEQTTNLKTVLQYHLDLIHHQRDKINKIEKSLQEIKKENNNIKLKLRRMDRRIALPKSTKVPHAMFGQPPTMKQPQSKAKPSVIHVENPGQGLHGYGPQDRVMFKAARVYTPLGERPKPPETITKIEQVGRQQVGNPVSTFGHNIMMGTYTPAANIQRPDTPCSTSISQDMLPTSMGLDTPAGPPVKTFFGMKRPFKSTTSTIIDPVKRQQVINPGHPNFGYFKNYTAISSTKKPAPQTITSQDLISSTLGKDNPPQHKVKRFFSGNRGMKNTTSNIMDSIGSNQLNTDEAKSTINNKPKMINTYSKFFKSTTQKQPQYSGSLCDKLQLIDTKPTGDDPYQMCEADMRDQSPIPKLMLQKSNQRSKNRLGGVNNDNNNLDVSRFVYDSPGTNVNQKKDKINVSKITNKSVNKVNAPYSSTFGLRTNSSRKRKASPNNMHIYKQKTEVDKKDVYKPFFGTTICEPKAEKIAQPFSFFNTDKLNPDKIIEKGNDNDINWVYGGMGEKLTEHPKVEWGIPKCEPFIPATPINTSHTMTAEELFDQLINETKSTNDIKVDSAKQDKSPFLSSTSYSSVRYKDARNYKKKWNTTMKSSTYIPSHNYKNNDITENHLKLDDSDLLNYKMRETKTDEMSFNMVNEDLMSNNSKMYSTESLLKKNKSKAMSARFASSLYNNTKASKIKSKQRLKKDTNMHSHIYRNKNTYPFDQNNKDKKIAVNFGSIFDNDSKSPKDKWNLETESDSWSKLNSADSDKDLGINGPSPYSPAFFDDMPIRPFKSIPRVRRVGSVPAFTDTWEFDNNYSRIGSNETDDISKRYSSDATKGNAVISNLKSAIGVVLLSVKSKQRIRRTVSVPAVSDKWELEDEEPIKPKIGSTSSKCKVSSTKNKKKKSTPRLPFSSTLKEDIPVWHLKSKRKVKRSSSEPPSLNNWELRIAEPVKRKMRLRKSCNLSKVNSKDSKEIKDFTQPSLYSFINGKNILRRRVKHRQRVKRCTSVPISTEGWEQKKVIAQRRRKVVQSNNHDEDEHKPAVSITEPVEYKPFSAELPVRQKKKKPPVHQQYRSRYALRSMSVKKAYFTHTCEKDSQEHAFGSDPDANFEQFMRDFDPNVEIEVPTFDLKPYKACRENAQKENTDDSVYIKRHRKLEAEEKRQLRIYMRFVREQTRMERLRQRQRQRQLIRQLKSRSTAPTPQPEVAERSEIRSIWPNPYDTLEEIHISRRLPVSALGHTVPILENRGFRLPWEDSERSPGKRYKRSKTLN